MVFLIPEFTFGHDINQYHDVKLPKAGPGYVSIGQAANKSLLPLSSSLRTTVLLFSITLILEKKIM